MGIVLSKTILKSPIKLGSVFIMELRSGTYVLADAVIGSGLEGLAERKFCDRIPLPFDLL